MNKLTKLLTAVIGCLVLVVVAAGSALAHDGDGHAHSEATTVQATSGPTEQKLQDIKNRSEKRKSEFLKTRLTNVQTNRLQSRCKNSQGTLRSVEGRIKGIETSRHQVYGNLIDHLKNLSSKLNTQDIDTTQLDEQIKFLEEKIASFRAALDEYKQAVSDLADMDCEADPEAFQAALEQARDLRKTLFTSGQEVKQDVRETIKPTLAAIRAELVASEENNGEVN